MSAYYAYGQGYDAYAYGATQDPSAYAYGAYAGYGQYPHQVTTNLMFFILPCLMVHMCDYQIMDWCPLVLIIYGFDANFSAGPGRICLETIIVW